MGQKMERTQFISYVMIALDTVINNVGIVVYEPCEYYNKVQRYSSLAIETAAELLSKGEVQVSGREQFERLECGQIRPEIAAWRPEVGANVTLV